MNAGFGHEVPTRHAQAAHRSVTRYMVLISSGGVPLARLFLENREQVAEFDATTEEVVSMIRGLHATHDATTHEWDRALAGHSPEERAHAAVYSLQA